MWMPNHCKKVLRKIIRKSEKFVILEDIIFYLNVNNNIRLYYSRLMTGTEKNILEQIKQRVLAIEPEAEVILFGSRARGDAREDSDWDLLILLDGKVDFVREDKIHDVILDIELKNSVIFSTMIRNRQQWQSKGEKGSVFYGNVMEEGYRISE